MGTRAAFWVGDPTEDGEWLGCVAWDGYPDGLPELGDVEGEAEFREVVTGYAGRDDFASPQGGWPYPWADDVFLTDYTYAWLDGELRVAHFRSRFTSIDRVGEGVDVPEHEGVPAPVSYEPTQPDSVMVVEVRADE